MVIFHVIILLLQPKSYLRLYHTKRKKKSKKGRKRKKERILIKILKNRLMDLKKMELPYIISKIKKRTNNQVP